MWIGRNRKARVTYGFDEIALVPGEITINPNEVDTSFKIPRPDGSCIDLENPHHRQRHGWRDRRALLHRDGQAGRPGRHQSRRRANPLRQSLRSPGPNRQSGQGRSHHPHPEGLYRADQGGADRPARPGIEGRRRAGRRQFHSAKGRALRLHRPGGGRRPFRRAIHRFNGQTYFNRIQIARTGRFLPQNAHPRHHRQRRHLQRHPPIDGMRRGRRPHRRRPRRRLHQPRRARPGRSAGHRHGRLRRRARLSSQEDRAVTSPSSPTAA